VIAVLGEGCLVAQPLRLATAIAMSKTIAMRIEKAEMIRVLHDEPAFAEVFTSYLLTRNSQVEADLVDHLFNSSEKRLARTLLLLANFGKEGRPEPITMKISQEIGGTAAFGAYVGMVLDKNVGVIVLANETNVGFPDALGRWILDRVLGNAAVDHVAEVLKAAEANFGTAAKLFVKPTIPRPFPPVAPLAGQFANSSFGKAAVALEGGTMVMEFQATGAKLRLEPWDGDIFTARLIPTDRYAVMVDNLRPLPNGFVQFQMDKDGKLNLLRLSLDDGQAYEFHREEQ
jgi:Domain of unknown function (DUF3471)